MKTKINFSKSFFLAGLTLLSQLCFNNAANAQSSKGAAKDSVVFNFKAGEQTWTVPQGVGMVHVYAYGAQGGSDKGGKGGLVQSDLQVSAGTKLYINVGSQPSSNEGGYNGGGKGCGKGTGGGGATDIRVGGQGLEARAIVAGGGGGCGYGGSAGAGGGLEGGTGKYDDNDKEGHHIAKGGTQTEGGKGARAYFSGSGKEGTGGDGISNHGVCSNDAMAGGGGGYFGGAAGGAGGGGGGSSYTNANNKNVVHQQGVQEGNGKVVIYWEKQVN